MTITDDARAEGCYDPAPMRLDRTEGLANLSKPGAVYEAGVKWYLTTTEAVRFVWKIAHRRVVYEPGRIDTVPTDMPINPDTQLLPKQDHADPAYWRS
jgi:hypothetical protein